MMENLTCRVLFLFIVVLRLCQCGAVTEIKPVKFDRYAQYDGLSCPQSDVVFLQTNVRSKIDCVNRCSELPNCWCVFYMQGFCQGCQGMCHRNANLPMLPGTIYFSKRNALSAASGAIYYNSKFYLIVKTLKTWQDAQNYCNGLEATLVYIETQAELSWVATQLAGSHCWTDGILSYGQFVWSHSGAQINMNLFATGQPDGSGSCVQVCPVFNDLLDDYSCTIKAYFMCKTI